MRALYIKNFFFLSFTPCTPSRACVRATPGEEGERGKEVRPPRVLPGGSRRLRPREQPRYPSDLLQPVRAPVLGPHVGPEVVPRGVPPTGLGYRRHQADSPVTRQRRGPRLARWKHTHKE